MSKYEPLEDPRVHRLQDFLQEIVQEASADRRERWEVAYKLKLFPHSWMDFKEKDVEWLTRFMENDCWVVVGEIGEQILHGLNPKKERAFPIWEIIKRLRDAQAN